MRQRTVATVLVLAFFGVPPIATADMTYSLNSFAADQNGWTLTGSITTDGTIGDLSNSDILAWTWTVTQGSTTYSASSTEPSAVALIANTVMTNASGTQILVPAGQIANGFSLSVGSGFTLEWENSSTISAKTGYQAFILGGQHFWDTQDPQMGGYDPWIIAEAAAVPEPSTLAMALMALVVGIGYTARRHLG